MRQRELFYRSVGTSLRAGIPIESALAQAGSVADPVGGEEFVNGLQSAARDLAAPPYELSVLELSEEVGRLDEALLRLADELERERDRRRSVLGRIAYPVLVAHLVPCALFASLLVESPAGFVVRVSICWVVGWAAVATLVVLMRCTGPGTAAGRALDRIPGVGAVRRHGAAATLVRALAWQESAGIALPRALESTRSLVLHTPVERAHARMAAALQGGADGAEAFATFHELDEPHRLELVNAVRVGHGERALERVADRLADAHARGLDRLARVFTGVLYAACVVLVAWTVLRFWCGHFARLEELVG